MTEQRGETRRFRSTVEQARGPGATVVLVPPEHVEALGGIHQRRVYGKVNGVDFMTATFPYRSALYIGLPKAARVAAGLVLGDESEFEVALDLNPPDVAVPPELAAAFEAEPSLRERYDALSRSRKRLIADPISQAVKPETRTARLEKALAELRSLG